MFHYAPPSTSRNGALAASSNSNAMADMFFEYPLLAPSTSCSMAEYSFARDLQAHEMPHAFHRHDFVFGSHSFHNMHSVDTMPTTMPLDLGAGGGWGFLDTLEPTPWLPDSAFSVAPSSTTLPATSTSPATGYPPSPSAATARSQNRERRTRCPEEVDRRREHRRVLQQGYEKIYRQRKRKTREQLRVEWLSLEYELKNKLVAAQNRAVHRPDTSAKQPRPEIQLEDLCAECTALRAERAVMECMLVEEARLRDAREYFTQPKMREKLNALATTPIMLKFTFAW